MIVGVTRQITSPTCGPPTPCKQALNSLYYSPKTDTLVVRYYDETPGIIRAEVLKQEGVEGEFFSLFVPHPWRAALAHTSRLCFHGIK